MGGAESQLFRRRKSESKMLDLKAKAKALTADKRKIKADRTKAYSPRRHGEHGGKRKTVKPYGSRFAPVH
jgi:hypothetical protein